MIKFSPLNKRRWRNFRSNRRAFWSLIIFTGIFLISLFAELIANDKPILVKYRGDYFTPIFNFYPETAFGGDFKTEAVYSDPVVKCLIHSGGLETCFDSPEITLVLINSNELDASLYKHDFMMLYSALVICALFVESVILVPVKRIESSSWLNLENSIVICSLSITGSLKSD